MNIATTKAQAFVRNALRGSGGQMPPGAAHFTKAASSLRTLRGVLSSALRTYQSVSNDFVRRYQHVAQLNSLPFDLSRETLTAKVFSETLSDACLDFLQGRKARSLPPWRRMMQSEWRPELNVIAEGR